MVSRAPIPSLRSRVIGFTVEEKVISEAIRARTAKYLSEKLKRVSTMC